MNLKRANFHNFAENVCEKTSSQPHFQNPKIFPILYWKICRINFLLLANWQNISYS